jgi:hypothetical protein
VTIDAYVRRRQIDLGCAIRATPKVYLDTNFWIWLRDASMGRGSSKAQSLLARLRRAVGAGFLLCPISETLFLELFKQRDLLTRRATAILMDELSRGVALLDAERRTMTEVGYFVYQTLSPRELYELDEIVWGKVGYVLGVLHPEIEGLPADLLLRFQQDCFDAVWDTPLASFVEALGDDPTDTSSFDDLATRLNRETKEHAAGLKSFQGTYRAEVRGGADLVGPAIAEAVTDIAIKQGRVANDFKTPSGDRPSLERWKNIVAYALAADKGDARMVLRSIHIHASLHAAHRWDKQRKFEGNDIADFQHAAAALAYCDAFFTEQPLRTMIQQKHVALDQLYNCTVASRLGEAEAYLDNLAH